MKRANRIKLALHRGAARAFVLSPLVFLLVAGAGCPSLFESTTQRAAKTKQAMVGTNGARTISAANTVVNAYAALAGTDPAIGGTTVTVADVTTLATGFSGPLAQGDLVLIVQMAGATIDVTDTASYGTVANLGNAGNYEFAGVESVAGNVITLACPLKNAYTVAGKAQVIRVPQYTNLTIAAGGSVTAPAWNGTVGGVVALHAESTLQLNGAIDASAKGFRGGSTVGDNASQVAGTAVTLFRSAVAADGAEKGEGIAGYQDEYTNGRYGRGAPANAGGGGNSHNAAGGGGANAPSGTAWTGQGVMLSSVVGAAAWALDPGDIAAGGLTTSQGGGRGGYSYSGAAQNPLTVGPDDASWGGNNRRQVGGLGGHPLTGSPATRLFMGGGGGAGDGNDGVAGPGGVGGGMVFIIAGTIAGTGSVLANGAAGGNAVAVGNGDAAGGGGGGGSVLVHAAAMSAITISANGGVGGNQVGSSGPNEVEGPGGGGGGGYIAVAGGTPTRTANGGIGGTTDRGALSAFPSNGATAGNAGLTSGDASTFLYCGSLTGPVTTFVNKPSSPSGSATGAFTFQSTESGVVDLAVTYECNLDSAGFAACNASYTTPTLSNGSHTLAVQATDLSGNVETPAISYTWQVDSTLPVTTLTGKPTNPTNNPIGSFTFTNTETPVTYQCNLDNAGFAACTASYSTGSLADGSHTLQVFATDASSNVEDPPVSYTWVIDTVAPNTTIDTNPTDPSTALQGDFTFGSNESPVTFQCNLDNAGWLACFSTYTTPALSNGSHTLAVRATDAAGNTDATPATFTWQVNSPLPVTTIATKPANPSNSAIGNFTFTNTKDPVTYECNLDTAGWASCGATYSTPTLADGSHTLQVRSTDAGSNREDPPVSYTWIIDTVAPDTTIANKPDNPSGSAIGVFTFTSSEDPSTFECRIDGGVWAACTATFSTPVLSDGSHTLDVRAKDAAGNVDNTPATYSWDIIAGALDGGTLDGGGLDSSGLDGEPVTLPDAPPASKDSPIASDLPPVVVDAGVIDAGSIDAQIDAGGIDLGVLLDVGQGSDVVLLDAGADAQPAGAEPSPDTAPPPAEPTPDAAVVVNNDAPPAANQDAAIVVTPENLKLMGSGFCAITHTRSTSPAGFLLLALAGLAVLRRRRR